MPRPPQSPPINCTRDAAINHLLYGRLFSRVRSLFESPPRSRYNNRTTRGARYERNAAAVETFSVRSYGLFPRSPASRTAVPPLSLSYRIAMVKDISKKGVCIIIIIKYGLTKSSIVALKIKNPDI